MDLEDKLTDTIFETLKMQSAHTVRHNIQNNLKNGNAIMREWMLPNGECLINKYLTETTGEVEERIFFTSYIFDSLQSANPKIIEGEFWFNSDVQSH